MIYNISKFRQYVRDLDNRLLDVDAYPDTWLDSRIEEGFAVAQDVKPVFITKEKYDLTINFTPIAEGGDGLEIVEVILQEEPHSIQQVTINGDFFSYSITYNNHIIVTKNKNAPNVDDKTMTVVYYFHPTLPISDIEMSMDMYRFVKEGIAANCFSALSDEPNEKYHLDKLKLLSVSSTLDVDHNALIMDDTKLWRQTWA